MRRRREANPIKNWRELLPWAVGAGLVGLGAYAVGPQLIASVKEARLEPETLARYLQLKQILAGMGIQLFTGSTRRSEAEQQANVEKGVSSTSISWHLVGRAVDAYPIDPATGKPDLNGRRGDLFRIMHQQWARLGGRGLAYLPYPNGPVRQLTNNQGRRYWDGGHLEFHGPFATAAAAYNAERGRAA